MVLQYIKECMRVTRKTRRSICTSKIDGQSSTMLTNVGWSCALKYVTHKYGKLAQISNIDTYPSFEHDTNYDTLG
jgi:hypothetical protein